MLTEHMKKYRQNKEKTTANLRNIKKLEKDGTTKDITVDWDKLPCSKCDRRYHFCCPKPDCWNKKGAYEVY